MADKQLTEEEREAAARRRARLRKKRAIQKRNRMIRRCVIAAAAVIILIIIAVVALKGCGKDSKESEESTFMLTSEAASESESESMSETEAVTESAAVVTEAITTQAETTAAATTAAAATGAMSRHEIHQGQWDLSTLDATAVPFGYAEENLDANMIPTDWAYYENMWGQFNVDWIQDTSQKVIYLTMDCGFPNDVTEGILDTLKEKNVKATFFITKTFFDGSQSTIQRMIDEGHQIGNHTCTHPNMTTLSIEDQTSQIMTLQNAMLEQFGYEMKLFRYPQGQFSAQSLGLVENLGLKAVFWSYAYNDYSDEQPPVQESYEKAVSHLHPGAVYLLHASSSTNAAFLADWIDAARAEGYTFGIYPTTAN